MNLYHEPVGQLNDGRYAKYVQLEARDVDLNNRWKLASVFETFQEIAGEQCVGLGFGWNRMMEEYGYCFVIVRMYVEMDAYPGANETVRVETWPENKLRLIFTRYFRIVDQSGKVIGRAVSNWVLFDMKERRIVKPQSCPIVQTPDTSSLEPPVQMPRSKPDMLLGEEIVFVSRLPAYSDFDYNGHVNNARYVEWVQDALPVSCYHHFTKTFDIYYEHEIEWAAFSGQPGLVSLQVGTAPQTGFCICGNLDDGTRCFTCKGMWQPT